MKNIILFTLTFCLNIFTPVFASDFSSSDIEANLPSECEPLVIVAGCVNAESGSYFKSDIDLRTNTIDPLQLIRFYDSRSRSEHAMGVGMGFQYPLYAFDIKAKASENGYLQLSERECCLTTYKKHGKGEGFYYPDLKILKSGYTNVHGIEISAKTNIINRSVYWDKNAFEVVCEDGTKRYYAGKRKLFHKNRFNPSGENIYSLKREIKPNGNYVYFEYGDKDSTPYLSKITTYNRTHTNILNVVNLSPTENGFLCESSCQNNVRYEQNKKNDWILLKNVHSHQTGDTSFDFSRIKHRRSFAIHEIYRPNGYHGSVKYDNHRRVSSLSHSVGENNSMLITHKFKYGDDYTRVTAGLGYNTIYEFDKNKRVKHINYYNKSHNNYQNPELDESLWHKDSFVKKDCFEWYTHKEKLAEKTFYNERNFENPIDYEGWLKTKSVIGQNGVFHKKQFGYDKKGNVVKETIFGNITGLRNETFVPGEENQTDTYINEYEYSKDIYNLKTKFKNPTGLTVDYQYLPNTNLKIKEILTYAGRIQERKFWSYDDNGEISEYVEDDGSSLYKDDYTNASYRRLTRYKTITQNSPAFGKPEIIDHYYVRIHERDEILLTSTIFTYDERGNKTCKVVTGLMGQTLSTHYYSHDCYNRLVEETNSLGSIKRYGYDRLGNRTSEEGVSAGKTTHYYFNTANKIERTLTQYTNGEQLTTRHFYDMLGNLTKEIDTYGNTTIFSYDSFSNLIETQFSPVETAEGVIQNPTSKKTYNILGQVLSETNANGETTTYTKTIFDKPIKTTYPDGSIEVNTYNKKNELERTDLADGSFIMYHHDPKGRVTRKDHYGSDNKLVDKNYYCYKGDCLNYEVDYSNITTKYFYDAAGRLVGSKRLDKVITYQLDDLGRKTEVKEGDRLTRYTYDAEGNVLTEKLFDEQGKNYADIAFLHDSRGNLIEKKTEVLNGVYSTITKSYDADDNLINYTDALGNVYSWNYNKNFINTLNQNVLEVTKKEPSGRTTRTVYDSRSKVTLEEIFLNDTLLHSKQFFYSLVGEVEKEVVLVISDNTPTKTYIVTSKYDKRGRLAEQTEEGEKTVRYSYDVRGNLTQKILPDGTCFKYTYDALNRCLTSLSSDNTVSYSFKYDYRGNLIETHDIISGSVLHNVYDKQDRLVEEEFLNELKNSYKYDIFDRLTEVTFFDKSGIRYSYDAFNLISSERFSQDGKTLYAVKTDNYDKKGGLLEITNNATKISYKYDLLGRVKEIASSKYKSSYDGYDTSGNLITGHIVSPTKNITSLYAYDGLNQLISEEGLVTNLFNYDSLGNCKKYNGVKQDFNNLNQLTKADQNSLEYDINGRLVAESDNKVNYKYDALGRLTKLLDKSFSYDSQNRCLNITSSDKSQNLLYIGEKEIAAVVDNKISDLRVVHPDKSREFTFAIESEGKTYYTQQDSRHNIVLLESPTGTVCDEYIFSTFKEELSSGKNLSPWRFANRRQIDHLSLFTHRFYHQNTRRWLTKDPLGFADGYNLYNYSKNNTYRFYDADGRFVYMYPLVVWGATATWTALNSTVVLNTLAAATVMLAAAAGHERIRQQTGKNILGDIIDNVRYSLNSESATEAAPEVRIDEVHDSGKVKPSSPDTIEITFPENPDDLLPEHERVGKKGVIYLNGSTRIRGEKHAPHEKDFNHNPRHHDQHYHVDKLKKGASWKDKGGYNKLKPPGYTQGSGTGFLPGETAIINLQH